MNALRPLLLPIFAMCAVVAASNVLVQYPFSHFGLGEILTWGAFTYPVAFLVNDLTNRRLGPAAARKVVVSGFVIAVVLSAWLATPRIAAASGSAFLFAQMLDISVFDKLRRQSWWKAPFLSTVMGSVLDTLIFFSLAFSARFAFLDAVTRSSRRITGHAGRVLRRASPPVAVARLRRLLRQAPDGTVDARPLRRDPVLLPADAISARRGQRAHSVSRNSR